MEQERRQARRVARRCRLAGAVLALAMAVAPAVSTLIPACFHWKTLAGANAVPAIFMTLNGNANPIDPAHTVIPGASIEATVAPVGYAHTFAFFGRSAMVAALVPVG